MNPSVTPLRYPGGKATLINYVEKFLTSNDISVDYILEPYAGTASISIGLLRDNLVSYAYINDADQMVYAFWKTIIDNNTELIEMVNSVDVTLDTWLNYKKYLIDNPLGKYNQKDLAMAFLFLNRTSFSGIIKAGPLGGKKQNSKYGIGCRFNKKRITDKIHFLSQFSDKISIYNHDGIKFMGDMIKEQSDAFIYVDPPYYKVGKLLYNVYFTQEQHEELANYLKSIEEQPWLLSYNNEEFILNLYSEKHNQEIYLDYHSGHYRTKIKEYVFSNRVTPAYEIKEHTRKSKPIIKN
ncbi:DNA adenine methylase [Ferroplasma sp.]|uniref:DNA adenine methylase n=1 Tax=Ferroplasma sp. TaxID=2591003 RepID=UPI0026306576|nr:DNA adenine methylase [Ferroplasma sp.]